MSKGEKKCYITFIDDFSRHTRLYLLKWNDEKCGYFIKLKAEIEIQLYKRTKRLKTDIGGDYESNSFNVFCEEHCINHEIMLPYLLKSNKAVESEDKTLKDIINVMLLSFRALLNLYEETILVACHI